MFCAFWDILVASKRRVFNPTVLQNEVCHSSSSASILYSAEQVFTGMIV